VARSALGPRTGLPLTVEAANTVYRLCIYTMTHNSDTPSQLSDLIRSVEARITTPATRRPLSADSRDVHDQNETVDTPLYGLPHDQLCPGNDALQKLMAQFR